ncbi:MAG: TRAP transporter large permease [Paracoccaceae bacterium]
MIAGALSFAGFLLLVALRVPVALAMGLTGFVGTWALTGSATVGLARLTSEPWSAFASHSLSIVPLFLLMGAFAARGGLSSALFDAARALVGHRRGGVAMAAIGACAGFGAICGSSLATAATMGRVALPQLRAAGHSGGFAQATLAAGGTLGILIPPSVVLVIYAILTEQNVATLFAAAIVPGLIAALGYGLTVRLYVARHPAEARAAPRADWPARGRALARVWPVAAIFALVVGGIYAGAFTPTEGASVGAVATGLLAWARGGLGGGALAECLTDTARTTAMIFAVILGAAFYNGFLALTGAPRALAEAVAGLPVAPLVVVALILIFYLVMGCVMDSLSLILLTVPILWPVVASLDIVLITPAAWHAAMAEPALAMLDPGPVADDIRATIASGAELSREQASALDLRLSDARWARANADLVAIWFGILVLIVVEVGLITPPVGLNLFVIGAMDADTPPTRTWRAVSWFVTADLARVALLLMVPGIALIAVV